MRWIPLGLILIPFFTWIVGFSMNWYYSSNFGDVGSNVVANDVNFVMDISIIPELSSNDIVLFDETRKLVFIYDETGTLLNKFKIHDTGSVYITNYDNEQNLTVYSVRGRIYHIIDIDGNIIESYEGDIIYPDDVPDRSSCLNSEEEVCTKFYFFYNGLAIGDEIFFVSFSFLPIIFLLAGMFLLGMRLEVKMDYKRRIKKN